MADPHNPNRYGEVWPQHRIDAYLREINALKAYAVFSGGWAWHFMSPPGHTEYKHAHDHKDVDILVPPRVVSTAMEVLKSRGFEKVPTRFDSIDTPEEFRRYEKVVKMEGHPPFKITIDFFVKDVPVFQCPGGWLVVEPKHLLSLYKNIHSSDNCWAVKAAHKLIEAGVSPLGRPELVEQPSPGISVLRTA